MKFQLEPDNRGADDETLLNSLREVAASLGKDYVTKEEYNALGRWWSTTFQKRFGSWCKAHELAGLHKIRNYHASREDCVKEIQRVAKKLGTLTLSRDQYTVHGILSPPTIARHCGSWNAALRLAGLSTTKPYPKGIPTEELFENLERLWESLGRQPRVNDFVKPMSKYSRGSYTSRFGSFRKALEAFVASLDEHDTQKAGECVAESATEPVAPPLAKPHRTPRTASWKARFLVMRRDNFQCCICGASPQRSLARYWSSTTYFPGSRAARPLWKTCKHCVSLVTGERVIY